MLCCHLLTILCFCFLHVSAQLLARFQDCQRLLLLATLVVNIFSPSTSAECSSLLVGFIVFSADACKLLHSTLLFLLVCASSCDQICCFSAFSNYSIKFHLASSVIFILTPSWRIVKHTLFLPYHCSLVFVNKKLRPVRSLTPVLQACGSRDDLTLSNLELRWPKLHCLLCPQRSRTSR